MRIISYIVGGVVGMIMSIIQRIIGLSVIMGIFYGGLYFYMQADTKRKVRYDKMMEISKTMPERIGQLFTIVGMPEIAEVIGADPKTKKDKPSDVVKSQNPTITPKMIQSVLENIGLSANKKSAQEIGEVPYQLLPIMDVFMLTTDAPKYRKALSVSNVGKRGEKAIPMLKKALYSKSYVLRDAAYESLERINTEESIVILNEYDRKIQR